MSSPVEDKTKSPVDIILTEGANSFLREIIVPEGNVTIGKKIMDLAFPEKGIIAMISRNNEFLTPKGTTVIQPNDLLIVLYESDSILDQVYDLLELDRKFEEAKEYM